MRGEICIGAVTEAEPCSSLSRVAAQSAYLKASSFVMCVFFGCKPIITISGMVLGYWDSCVVRRGKNQTQEHIHEIMKSDSNTNL